MFVLRKLLKLLLLPVAFVLFFTSWALETSMKLTEWAVGLLTLIVGAAIIYSIVIHRWGGQRRARYRFITSFQLSLITTHIYNSYV